MQLAVVSDCHGAWRDAVLRLKDLHLDGLVYLGDMVVDGERLAEELAVEEFWCVCGNCDLLCDYEQELVLELDEIRILVFHGHTYGVKSSLLGLKYRALELGCQCVLFGHSHVWCDMEEDGVRLCNPGSVGRPRDVGASVGILEIDCGKMMSFTRLVI